VKHGIEGGGMSWYTLARHVKNGEAEKRRNNINGKYNGVKR